jgi:hypothetical protein
VDKDRQIAKLRKENSRLANLATGLVKSIRDFVRSYGDAPLSILGQFDAGVATILLEMVAHDFPPDPTIARDSRIAELESAIKLAIDMIEDDTEHSNDGDSVSDAVFLLDRTLNGGRCNRPLVDIYTKYITSTTLSNDHRELLCLIRDQCRIMESRAVNATNEESQLLYKGAAQGFAAFYDALLCIWDSAVVDASGIPFTRNKSEVK